MLYAILNNLTIYATALLNPHVFALFSNMKLMFAAVLTKVLLDKKFSTVQWVSIFLLIMCLVVSKLDMFLDCQPKLSSAKRSLMTRGLLAAEDQADAADGRPCQPSGRVG